MRTLTRTGALALALLLALCLSLQPILAEEPGAPAPAETADSGAPPSSPEADGALPPAPAPPPVSESAVVSTWADLTAWIGENWTVGGTVRLGDNVTADGTYDLMGGKQLFKMKPMTIDCGEHTIYIDNGPGAVVSLASSNFQLTVRGQGGGEGLLHVRPGGTLLLDMLSVEAEGAALVQEEGAVLGLTQEDQGYAAPPRVEGEIVYAQRPVLTGQDDPKLYLAVVPGGQPLTEDLLPAAVRAKLNYRGELTDLQEWPAAWETGAGADQLERRERTILAGRPAGDLTWNGETWPEGTYEIHSPPACLVAFLEDGAALLELGLKHRGQLLFGSVFFQVEPGAEELRLLTSADEGKTWSRQDSLSGEDAAEIGEGSLFLYLEDAACPVWLLVEAVYPGGRIVHTDTVAVDREQTKPAAWSDGHRGGGAPLLPPPDTDSPGAADPPPDTAVPEPPDGEPPETGAPDGGLPADDPPAGGTSGSGSGGGGPSGGAAIVMPPANETDAEPGPASPPPSESEAVSGSAAISAPEPAPPPAPASSKGPEPDRALLPDASAGEPAPPPASTSIVPQPADAVQPDPGAPAPETAPGSGREGPGGLPPAAQLALGGAAAAVLAAGAASYFNPRPVRRLLDGLAKFWRKK